MFSLALGSGIRLHPLYIPEGYKNGTAGIYLRCLSC